MQPQAQVQTLTYRVSGGEIAVQVKANGRKVFWMNGHRVDRSTIARKLER